MEQLIVKFKLPLLERLDTINYIVSQGWKKTDNKFHVVFNGSKGYLDSIEIGCEGIQPKNRENFIDIYSYRAKCGKLMNKMVSIYHSEEKGVRVEIKE